MEANGADVTGGWCWFQERRVAATGDHTFVGWTEYDTEGTVSVAAFDHDDGTFTVNRGIGTTPAKAPDDHNAPALYLRQDGRVVVFYTTHNHSDGNRYRVSEEPYGVDSFGGERSLPDSDQSTYPMPFWLSDPGKLFYFYRDAPGDDSPSTFYYYRSPDDGETWGPRRQLFEIAGDDYSGYVKVDAGDDRIDICFSRHPRSAELPHCDVRHFYYDVTDDRFRDSHGNRIPAPVRERDMTQVFDARAMGERGWIWDVQTVGDEPAIAFASFTDGAERDQRYYYAKYTGSEWAVEEVVETDHLHATNHEGVVNEAEYAPGVYLGHEQGDDVLYLSRNAEPREDERTGLQVEQWRVEDPGTFQRERVVAGGDESNQFRPVVPRSVHNEGHESPINAVWMCDQSSAPYHYHDETETVKLAAEIETAEGTEIVRMDEWGAYGEGGE